MTTASGIFRKAALAREHRQPARAFALFSSGAVVGDESCMVMLGYCYDMGEGTGRSTRQAMYWYKRAYAKGSTAAASNIAVLYRERSSPRLAYKWFERAALLGDGDASLELAKLRLLGAGVSRSEPEGLALLEQAATSSLITPAGREESLELLAWRPRLGALCLFPAK